MALLFGSPKKSPVKKNAGRDKRLEMAREGYLNGKIKLVTTDEIPGREIQGVFGLIVCRGYNFDKAFYGLLAQAQDVNADAVVGYRETVSFHPEGDKYFSCYGTACRLKQKK